MKTIKKSLQILAGIGLASLACTNALAEEAKAKAFGDPNRWCAPLTVNTPAPGVVWAITESPNAATYQSLYFYLFPYTIAAVPNSFTALLGTLQTAQAEAGNPPPSTPTADELNAYAAFKTTADAFVAAYPGSSTNGARLVCADPDGTVVYDSAKSAATATCGGSVQPVNSFQCYLAKAINENHNTRVSIMDSEMWPCRAGAETKFSTTVNTFQTYVALGLGSQLGSMNNTGVLNNVGNNGVCRFGVNTPS